MTDQGDMDRTTEPFWNGGMPSSSMPVADMIRKMVAKSRLHHKTHRQGDTLYVVDGRMWIRCYTHKRFEPASWL